eukprot:gene13210-13341_t
MAAAAETLAAGSLQNVNGLPPADTKLPALQHVPNRTVYRSRPEEENEEAHWYSAEEPELLVQPEQVHLRSIHSKQSAVIVFSNKTQYRVRALWLDFNGDEVVYSVLEPNSTKRYHTYITHPWIVREVNSGTRMLLSGRPAVVGMSGEQAVEVQAPPQLSWSLETHSCFPDPFKQSVKALLLAHKNLEKSPGTACQQSSAVTSLRYGDDSSCSSRKRPWTAGSGSFPVSGSKKKAKLFTGHRSSKPRHMLNNIVTNIKSLMSHKARALVPEPALSTTNITVEVTYAAEADDDTASSDLVDVDGSNWSVSGTHLGSLPSHVLSRIAELAAPTTYQSVKMAAKGRPGIQPILMACPPRTKEEEAAEAAAQAAQLQQDDTRLPVLQHVACQMLYHTRSEEESEEVHLKSIHSKQNAMIIFRNSTPYTVRALWLNFSGNEVAYSVLEPNSTKRYHTYITHPWIVREVNSGTRMLLSGRPAVVGMSGEQAVEVQAPPQLSWSLETHSCFPDPFKQSVKALLLAHKKLQTSPGAACQQPSAVTFLRCGDDSSCSSRKRPWSGVDPDGTAMPVPLHCRSLGFTTATSAMPCNKSAVELSTTSSRSSNASSSSTTGLRATIRSSMETGTLGVAVNGADDGSTNIVNSASVLNNAQVDPGNARIECASAADAVAAVAASAASPKGSKRTAEVLRCAKKPKAVVTEYVGRIDAT